MTIDHVDDVAGGTVDSAKSSPSPNCGRLGKCGVITHPSDTF